MPRGEKEKFQKTPLFFITEHTHKGGHLR